MSHTQVSGGVGRDEIPGEAAWELRDSYSWHTTDYDPDNLDAGEVPDVVDELFDEIGPEWAPEFLAETPHEQEFYRQQAEGVSLFPRSPLLRRDYDPEPAFRAQVKSAMAKHMVNSPYFSIDAPAPAAGHLAAEGVGESGGVVQSQIDDMILEREYGDEYDQSAASPTGTAVATAAIAALAGCSGALPADDGGTDAPTPEMDMTPTQSASPSPTATETPTPSPTPTTTPTPDPHTQELDRVLEEFDDETAEKLREQALQDGTVDSEDVRHVQLLADSTTNYTAPVVEDMPYGHDWSRDGDRLLYGAEENIFGTNTSEADTDIGEVRAMLASDGRISDNDLTYLNSLVNGPYNRTADWSTYAQLKSLGGLEFHAQDGEISDTNLDAIEDVDDDGIIDFVEFNSGLNRSDSDIDDDGLPDGVEYFNPHGIHDGANATRTDIFVENLYMDGVESLSPEVKEKIREQFNDSSVEGDINIHFVNGGTVPAGAPVNEDPENGRLDDFIDYRDKFSDYYGMGYHLAILGTKDPVINGERRIGATDESAGVMMVNGTDRNIALGPNYLHELTHLAGVAPDDFQHVDSREVPLREARSAMNYNAWERNPLRGTYALMDKELRHIIDYTNQPSTQNLKFPKASQPRINRTS